MSEDINWELIGKIKASEYRTRIVKVLAKGNKTPAELSKELNFHISHVSRALNELEKRGVVKCLTPKLRKGKIYSLTEEGKRIRKEVSS